MSLAVIGLTAYVIILQRRQRRFIRRAIKPQLKVLPHDHIRALRQMYGRLASVGGPPIPFHAEWGEDIFIFELFGPGYKGTYVEAGALDGIADSVTLALDRMGWKGVLVEPTPRNFARCQTHRPHARVVHAALGKSGSRGTTGFMVPKEDLHTRSAFRQHEGMNTDHLGNLARAGAELEEVQVPLTTMTDVLLQAGCAELDVAVIDVEGAELELLDGFDLQHIRTRVLIIEDNSLGRDTRVHDLLHAHGYSSPLWIGANRIYIRADETMLLDRALELKETMYSPFVRAHTDHVHDARLESLD